MDLAHLPSCHTGIYDLPPALLSWLRPLGLWPISMNMACDMVTTASGLAPLMIHPDIRAE